MIIRRNPGTLNMPAAPNGFLELVFKLPWVMLADSCAAWRYRCAGALFGNRR